LLKSEADPIAQHRLLASACLAGRNEEARFRARRYPSRKALSLFQCIRVRVTVMQCVGVR